MPFTLSLQVNNATGAQRLGMVRVFLAPKFDERGSQLSFGEQRLLMIELDKFVAACKSIKYFLLDDFMANFYSETRTEHFEETLN